VLALVIETCPSQHLDTKALCSLLQVSAACRQALQGSRGQHRVSIKATNTAVCGFTAWLPKWAGLVAEVHLQQVKPVLHWSEQNYEALSRKAGSNLFTAIQSCAESASTSAGAAPAAPAAMPLLLTGFRCDVSLSAEVMQGLPLLPPSLTRLELGSVSLWADVLPAALQRLSNLAHLKLERATGTTLSPRLSRHVTALQQLSRLTSLDMSPVFSADTKHLPTSLVDLRLQFEAGVRSESDSAGDYAVVDEWHEDWEESDGEDWPYGHAHPPPGDAGWRLDLSHLSKLQHCRLQQQAPTDMGMRVCLN
jgi:hypothetical protein